MTHDHDLPRQHDPLRGDERADLTGGRDHAGLGHRDLRDDRGAEGGGLVLHEEELRVRTERVPTGRVTFRKRIVTEERTLVVTVRREELEIVEGDGFGPAGQGRPETPAQADTAPGTAGPRGVAGNGTADPMGYTDPTLTGESLRGADHAGDLRRTPEGDFEIVLRAEEPVVTMNTVGIERVRVHVGTVTDTQQFTEQVSREEAVIEDDRHAGLADGDRRGDLGRDDFRGHDDHRGPRL